MVIYGTHLVEGLAFETSDDTPMYLLITIHIFKTIGQSSIIPSVWVAPLWMHNSAINECPKLNPVGSGRKGAYKNNCYLKNMGQ